MIRRRETGLITVPEQVGSEHTIARLRRHARVLIWPVVVLCGAVAGAAYVDHLLSESWMKLVLWVGAAVVILAFVAVPVFAWLASRVVITSRRIVVRHGLLSRHRRDIPFARITDVSLRRSPVQAALGSGDIFLARGSETGLRLRDLPGALLVHSAILQLVEANAPAPVARRPRDRAAWAEGDTIEHQADLVSA